MAFRPGLDLSCTLAGDLLSGNNTFQDNGNLTSINAEGIGNLYHNSAPHLSETPTLTNAAFVLRNTPGRPAGSKHVNRDMCSPDVSDLEVGEKSPSDQRQARKANGKVSEPSSHRPSHLRWPEHEAHPSVVSQPKVAQTAARKRYRSPISIPDSMSDDESLDTIEVDTTSFLKNNSPKSDQEAEVRLPIRKRRATKRAKVSPRGSKTPEVSLTKLQDIALAASALTHDDDETEEMESSPPSNEDISTPARQNGRTPRRAALRANVFVREICKQYPVLNRKVRARK